MDHYNKYQKYKQKYLELKNKFGGRTTNVITLDVSSNNDIELFRSGLKARGENWLVIYASNYTQTEKRRFKDPRWVFWDIKEISDDYFGIKGNFDKKNLEFLSDKLKNCFDYICFDDWGYYKFENKDDLEERYDFVMKIFNLLKIDGKLVIENILDLKESAEDEISKIYLIRKFISTPFGGGKGGDNLLRKCLYIINYLNNEKILIKLEEYPNINKMINHLFNGIKEEDKNSFFRSFCENSIRMQKIKENVKPQICQIFFDNFNSLEYDKEKVEKEYYELLNITTEHWKMPTKNNAEKNISGDLLIIKVKDNE